MRLTVITAGRMKPGPEKLIAEDYLTRAQALGRKSGISRIGIAEFSESQASSATARMGEEAKLFMGAMPPKCFSIVLDERGKALSSEAFAQLLRRQIDGGTQDVAFLIGGPDGHAPDIREQAGALLSFGQMTWPHRLVRVMLFEQIYRALTIIQGHPYHRA